MRRKQINELILFEIDSIISFVIGIGRLREIIGT
jgi:hypothetical protein